MEMKGEQLQATDAKPLGRWMEHYVQRNRQYRRWLSNGFESQEPVVFWLSGLHVPELLLSAIIQTMYRKKGWGLDKSTMYDLFFAVHFLRNSLQLINYSI